MKEGDSSTVGSGREYPGKQKNQKATEPAHPQEQKRARIQCPQYGRKGTPEFLGSETYSGAVLRETDVRKIEAGVLDAGKSKISYVKGLF